MFVKISPIFDRLLDSRYLTLATFLLCNQKLVGVVFSVQFQIRYNIYPQVSYIVTNLKSAEINLHIQTKCRWILNQLHFWIKENQGVEMCIVVYLRLDTLWCHSQKFVCIISICLITDQLQFMTR